MDSAIIGFVLAVLVPLGAGVVWLIFESRAQSSQIAQLSATCSQTWATLTTSCEQLRERVMLVESKCNATEALARSTTTAALSGQLADLGADVAKLAASVRKQFGSVWAELHQSGALERARGAQHDLEPRRMNGTGDPALDAVLALQSAPSAKGG